MEGFFTDSALEALLGTLLYEGYALYPYTSTAAKNATPTPFGIVYPPTYAEESSAAYRLASTPGDRPGRGGTQVGAELRFLQASAEGGHRAVERRLDIPGRSLAELEVFPYREPFAFDSLSGRVRLSATPLEPGIWRLAFCVHNSSELEAGTDRAGALRRSLLSTHPLMWLGGGTFASPLERAGALGRAVAGCASRNTFPVLATAQNDVLLGAAIVLPDHPELAPESRGDLFDGTEIEEALVLHVLALSDAERRRDRRGRSRDSRHDRARAAATPGRSGPASRPHGGLGARGGAAMSRTGLPDDEVVGEREVVVDGVDFRLGGKVDTPSQRTLRPLRPHPGRTRRDP